MIYFIRRHIHGEKDRAFLFRQNNETVYILNYNLCKWETNNSVHKYNSTAYAEDTILSVEQVDYMLNSIKLNIAMKRHMQ